MSSFRPFYSCLACCRQFISRLRIRFFVRWFPADDSRSIREATQPKSRANWEDQSEVFVDVVQAPVGDGIMKLMDVKTVSTSNLTPTACKFVLPSFFIAYFTQVPIWISNFLLQKREQTSQSHFSPAIGISSFFYLIFCANLNQLWARWWMGKLDKSQLTHFSSAGSMTKWIWKLRDGWRAIVGVDR